MSQIENERNEDMDKQEIILEAIEESSKSSISN